MRNLLLILSLLLIAGCGADTRTEGDSKREMVSESHTTTKTTTRHTPTEDGGFVVETVTQTDTTAGERSATTHQQTTHTQPDAGAQLLTGTAGRIAGAVMNKASGGIIPEGTGTALTGLLAAAVAAWGASKSSQANQLRQERDYHKGESDKGWDQAMTMAKKIRPEDA